MTLKDIIIATLQSAKENINNNYLATAERELKAALEDINTLYDNQTILHETFRFNEAELVDNFINYWKKLNIRCVPSNTVTKGKGYEFMLSFKKGEADKVKELVKKMGGELIK